MEEDQNYIPPTRKERAEEILRHPEEYKKCEICDSLLLVGVYLCTNCKGYRFNSDPEVVSEQALLLGASEQRSITPDDLAS